jgi:hypothetical protein
MISAPEKRISTPENFRGDVAEYLSNRCGFPKYARLFSFTGISIPMPLKLGIESKKQAGLYHVTLTEKPAANGIL